MGTQPSRAQELFLVTIQNAPNVRRSLFLLGEKIFWIISYSKVSGFFVASTNTDLNFCSEPSCER